MPNKLVSIIIPLYNAADFIGETIESVIAQTYTNWELIIVDNCSTDNSKKIVNDYCNKDKRISLIKRDINSGGPASPRNDGVKKSRGKYIAFLDADDIWASNKLENQVFFLEKKKDIMLLGSNAETFPQCYKNKLFLRHDLRINFEHLLKTNKFITSSVILRNEVISAIGLFDEAKEVIAAEDYDLWLRILKHYPNSGYVINKPLVKYRIHSQNISLGEAKPGKGAYDKLLYIYKKYPDYFTPSQIEKLEKNKDYLNLLQVIKDAYHREQFSTKQIFLRKDISIYDRFMLVVKKVILNLLKGERTY